MKILIYMQGKKNSCVSSSILETIRVGRQAKIKLFVYLGYTGQGSDF
jgi:hypothetical protein